MWPRFASHSWGLIDGVTTNPSLMAKTGRPYHDVLREICEIVDGPISAEVVATEASAIIAEGEKLAKLHNIVVKCPMIIEGLKATHALAKRGIRVNVTLIFTPLQALAAAKVGASFLSPFIQHSMTSARTASALVEDMVQKSCRTTSYPAEVLVACP